MIDALVQSDAEPVAWEYKTEDGWQRISLENYKILKGSSFELRPVFDTALLRPDASAGLREAADIAESLKGDAHLYTATEGGREGFVTACYEIAEALRYCAATDRSGE